MTRIFVSTLFVQHCVAILAAQNFLKKKKIKGLSIGKEGKKTLWQYMQVNRIVSIEHLIDSSDKEIGTFGKVAG